MFTSQQLKIQKMIYDAGFSGMSHIRCFITKMTGSAEDEFGKKIKYEFNGNAEVVIVLKSTDQLSYARSIMYINGRFIIDEKPYEVYDVDTSYMEDVQEEIKSRLHIESYDRVKSLLKKAIGEYIVNKEGG